MNSELQFEREREIPIVVVAEVLFLIGCVAEALLGCVAGAASQKHYFSKAGPRCPNNSGES